VTEVKSGPGFQKADHSALVAVMRRQGELARNYAERHGVSRWYDNAAALINDSEVDAVYIATPPSSHKEYTLMTAAAGKPVYVEKPMALNFTECQEMIAACRQRGRATVGRLLTGVLCRVFSRLKSFLTRALLVTRVSSALHFINQCRRRTWILTSKAGALIRQLVAEDGLWIWRRTCWTFSITHLVQLLKSRVWLQNQAGKYKAEDIVTGTFRFASGVQGAGTWCFSAYDSRDLIEIVGTEGKITFSTFDARPIALTTHDGPTEFSLDYPQHIEQPLIQMVVNELNGIGKGPQHWGDRSPHVLGYGPDAWWERVSLKLT